MNNNEAIKIYKRLVRLDEKLELFFINNSGTNRTFKRLANFIILGLIMDLVVSLTILILALVLV